MTITNTGQAVLDFSEISVYGVNFAQTNNCPSSLDVGASCTVSLTFTPKNVGAIEDELQVNSDGLNQTQFAKLDGTGAPPTTASGNYSIQVNAVMGNDLHSVTIPVTVQ